MASNLEALVMAAAQEEGGLPILVLADYLEEKGDARAERVRAQNLGWVLVVAQDYWIFLTSVVVRVAPGSQAVAIQISYIPDGPVIYKGMAYGHAGLMLGPDGFFVNKEGILLSLLDTPAPQKAVDFALGVHLRHATEATSSISFLSLAPSHLDAGRRAQVAALFPELCTCKTQKWLHEEGCPLWVGKLFNSYRQLSP